MSAVVAVVHQDASLIQQLETQLTSRGIHSILWHGSSGAHALVARRRPDLVVVASPLESREATLRLLEELCWDPGTRNIPVIVASTPRATFHGAVARNGRSGRVKHSSRIDDLVRLILVALGNSRNAPLGRESEAALSAR